MYNNQVNSMKRVQGNNQYKIVIFFLSFLIFQNAVVECHLLNFKFLSWTQLENFLNSKRTYSASFMVCDSAETCFQD